MKKIYAASLITFCFLFSASGVSAQKTSEAKINYDITILETDVPDEYLAMMPTQMTEYIKNDKMRIEMGMGMGNSQTIIFNNKEKTMTILMDMMGNKIAVVNSEAEVNKQKQEKTTGETKVEKKDETREIAGYKCKKAVVTQGDDSFDLFYTEDLGIKGNEWHSDYKGIEGCIMEYQVKQGNTVMKMTAKAVEPQKVDDSMFNIPEGYSLKTSEELKKMYGGRQ